MMEATEPLRDYIAIARPTHWIKNVFVIPGAVAAVMLVPGASSFPWLNLGIALLATCLAASANYVINEWLDAASDAHHPLKSSRPAVHGRVSRIGILVEYASLGIAAVALAAWVAGLVAGSIALLLVMGVLYNVPPLRLKDVPYADVLIESVNNAIRLLIGWFCVTSAFEPPVSLILGYWMGGAFLMAVKRLAEYRTIDDPSRAARYRSSFASYTQETLISSSMLYAVASSFLLGIFLLKYRIEYLIALPVLWALFIRYFSLAFREDSAAQKPESLYRERGLVIHVVVLVALVAVLTMVDLPVLRPLSGGALVPIGAIYAP